MVATILQNGVIYSVRVILPLLFHYLISWLFMYCSIIKLVSVSIGSFFHIVHIFLEGGNAYKSWTQALALARLTTVLR